MILLLRQLYKMSRDRITNKVTPTDCKILDGGEIVYLSELLVGNHVFNCAFFFKDIAL